MAGGAVNQNTFGYALKTIYPKGVHVEAQRECPFWALVPKDSEFVGESRKVAARHGTGAGRATTLAKARARTTANKGKRFDVERVSNYAVGSVKRETMKASKNDRGAIIRAYDTELEEKLNLMKLSLAHGVTGDGTGAMAKVKVIGGGAITLDDPDAVVLFEIDQTLQANPNKTGNAGTMRAGYGTITGVNRNTGVVTYTATGGWAPQVNDFLYCEDDYDNVILGVQAWVPPTDPTAGESFLGVDRSVDPSRLAGVRVTETEDAGDILEALIAFITILGRHGAAITHVFISFTEWQALQTLLEAKRQLTIEEARNEYGIGFQAIVLTGPRSKKVMVIADQFFPTGKAWGLKLDTWEFASLDEAPHVIQDDGTPLVRDGNDGFEFEIAYYANLICEAPGQNGVAELPKRAA